MGTHRQAGELRARIVVQVAREERRRARISLGISGGVLLCSASGLAYSLFYLVEGFASSPFYNYLSLMFSDSDVLAAYWRELVLSLAESLPLISSIVALALLASLLASARVFVQSLNGGWGRAFTNA